MHPLESFIAARLANHKAWAAHFLNAPEDEIDPNRFPYQIDSEAEGTVSEEIFVPARRTEYQVPTRESTLPSYLVSTPFYINPANGAKPLSEFVQVLKKGAFREGDSAQIGQRVCVTIGLNRRASIDERANRAFAQFVERLSVRKPFIIPFGFLWNPSWRKTHLEKKLYSRERCFRLLKAVRQSAAAKVSAALDAVRSAVPYQSIREYTKNAPIAVQAAEKLRESAPNAPLYLSLLDGDPKALHHLFDEYDAIILGLSKDGIIPDIVSTGYRAPADCSKGMKVAVELDMAIRAAMAEVFPLAPYYPEPNTIVRIPQKGIEALSFCGRGERLESRRLIENGLRWKQFDPKKLYFYPTGGVATDVARLETGTVNHSNDHETKGFLTALHGIGQTHSFPKLWAEQLYLALGIQCRVTDCTTPLMAIYGVYDFIRLATDFCAVLGRRYSPLDFRNWKAHYPNYVTALSTRNGAPFADLFYRNQVDPQKHQAVLTFFTVRYNLLKSSLSQLKALGLSDEQLAKITLVAQKSGEATHRVLSGLN